MGSHPWPQAGYQTNSFQKSYCVQILPCDQVLYMRVMRIDQWCASDICAERVVGYYL
jgi:hypothetical protein